MAVPYIPGAMTSVGIIRLVTTRDEYNNQVLSDSEDDDDMVDDCSFQPSDGSENPTDGDRFTERADLYLPLEAGLTGADQVRVGGRVWDIDGPVKNWPDVNGLGHQQARLVRFKEG